MNKFIFIFTILCLTIGCSNDNSQQNASETSQKSALEKVKPTIPEQVVKKKAANNSLKQKALDNKKPNPVEQLKVNSSKTKPTREMQRMDATGKPFEMSVADAKNRGTKLGSAYCNCLKLQKDKLKCNGIPTGVENIGKRYGKEIGDAVMGAFKVASKGCKAN